MTAPAFETWEEWAAYWRPRRAPDARPEDQEEMSPFLLEILKPEHRAFIEAHARGGARFVWTLRDGDGLSLVLCAGVHIVDRMAYVVCERPHDGYEATPALVLGDPEIEVVPEEMTNEEFVQALDDYEFEAAQEGERGRIGRRNLELLMEEKARRSLGQREE